MKDSKFNKDILFADFKPISITEKMREDVIKNPDKYINCPPRIRMGKFYTDEELDKYIEDSLKRPLPDLAGDKSFVKKRNIFRKK